MKRVQCISQDTRRASKSCEVLTRNNRAAQTPRDYFITRTAIRISKILTPRNYRSSDIYSIKRMSHYQSRMTRAHSTSE